MKADEYLKAAADAIERQLMNNPDLGIPVDPDVAEFMGAFEESAVSPGDFDPLNGEEGL